MYRPEEHHFKKFEKKVWLASPTMYPESMKYAMEAYQTNWMSTVGENINELEKIGKEGRGELCGCPIKLYCSITFVY